MPDYLMLLARPDGGSLRICVLEHQPPGASVSLPYVQLGRFGADDKLLAYININRSELDRVHDAILAARRHLLGHERHNPAESSLDRAQRIAGVAPSLQQRPRRP